MFADETGDLHCGPASGEPDGGAPRHDRAGAPGSSASAPLRRFLSVLAPRRFKSRKRLKREARAASKAENWPAAARAWEAAIKARGGRIRPDEILELARAHVAAGAIERAEAVIGLGRQARPDDLGLAVQWAELAMVREAWGEAAARWSDLVETFGIRVGRGRDERIAAAGYGLLENGECEGALAFIRRMRARRGERRSLLALEGIACLRLGRMQEARVLWTEYWQRAVVDEEFSRELVLRLSQRGCQEANFPVTARHREQRAPGAHSPRVCIYTALFEDYDELHAAPQGVAGVDFICFTDRPVRASGWDMRVVDTGEAHPILRNRKLKILPYEHLSEYDFSLYVDSNMIFVGDTRRLLDEWLAGKRFVAWPHPERMDIYRECEAILAKFRHQPEPILLEYEFFRREGVPENAGLIEAGFLWRDHRDAGVRELMEKWWEHLLRFSRRDQPGLAFWIWRTGIRPEVMPASMGSSRDNEFIARRPHRASTMELERESGGRNGKPRFIPATDELRSRGPRPPVTAGLRRRRLTWVYREEFRSVASTVMRGHQLAEIARRYMGDRVEVSLVGERELCRESGAILILTKGFLKAATLDELAAMKESGCTICADFVDDPPRDDLDEGIDVYIASSILQSLHFNFVHRNKPHVHITHHADPLLDELRVPEDRCRIGYFGELANVRYRDELRGGVDFWPVDTSSIDANWIEPLRKYNTHYAVRNKRRIDGFKPFLKGFTAAHCGANIVVPLDEGDARYYLGSDYPYILRSASLKSVQEMIEYVGESFAGPEWRRGLEMMESVRERSSPARIAVELGELLARTD